MVGFRGSTAGGTSVSRSASLREQIARALQADLLLLHQPTPNAFILLDPNPPACHWVEQPGQPTGRQRFRVTLGSQHCTCSAFTRAGLLSTCPVATSNTVSPCVHVLFVMLRVLRLSLDDPRILKTSLENHEVEPLLQQFAKRRASNFRLSTADTSPHQQSMTGRLAATAASGSSVSSSGGGGLPKLVMPRPVMRANSLTSAARAPAAFRGGGGGATPPSAFTPPLHVLAAMRAAIGEGSECSELSSITRSIAPAATARCRCASHASSCEGGGGGAACARGPKSRLSNGEEDEESDAAASSASAAAGAAAAPFGVRRPRTEPQPHHEVNNSRLDLLHSTSPRYSLSTTFRPIMDPSPSETDDQEEGTVSSSSQSSRLDAPPPPPPPPPHNFRPLRQRRSSSRHFSFSSAVAEEAADDESLERSGGGAVSRVANSCCSTLTSASRRTTTTCPHSRAGCLHSAGGGGGGGSTGSSSTTITVVGTLCATTDSPAKQSLAAETVLCLLCHRSGFGVEDETVSASAVCSAPDCSANFHSACFDIWQEECVLETGYLYCPVCGRPWSAEASNREPTETPRIPLESTRQLTSATSTRQTPETAETPAMPPSYVVLGAQEAEERDGDTTAAHVAASPASSSPAPTSASSSCTASYFRSNPTTTMTTVVTAPSTTTPTAAAAVAAATSTPVALMSPTNIPLLCQKNGWAAWVSAFSEEVALGITSPYWRVRQSALRQVGKITICRLLMSRQQPPSPPAGLPEEDYQCHSPVSTLGPESLRMAFRLIQHLLSDPADEVFLAALCAFREILGYLICLDSETQAALQRAISPVLRRLLIFVGGYLLPGNLPINCHIGQPPPEAVTSAAAAAVAAAAAESSMTQSAQDSLSAQESAAPAPPADARRRANLALATLVEFAKGQEGEMSIGRDTSNAAECMPISGVPHLAHFLLRSAKFHQTHLVGRLTLLEKLIQMHRAAAASSTATAADSTQRRISYRHLCSSLIFARRHVYPPEQPVFPHNYVSEVEARRWVGYHRRTDVVLMTTPTAETAAGSHAPLPDSQTPSPMALQEVKFSSSGSLMEANLKASRLARRVFIAVCRALLAEPDAAQTSSSTGSQRLPCAEDFVNSELSCLDASLAGRFRSKLADVLRPPAPQHHQPPQQQLQQQQQQQTVNQSSANLLFQHTQVLPTPPTIRLPSNTATITPSGVLAPDALPSGGVSQKQRPNRLYRLRSTDGVSGDPFCCSAERKTSAPFFPSSEEVPPMPPPRRLSQPAKQGRVELAPFATAAPRNNPPLPPPPPAPLPPAPPPPPPLSPLTHMFPSSVNVRVAPEPAYDPVAISETGPYSSSESEEEEEEEDEGSECSEHKKTEESLEKLDWRTGHLRESSSSRGRGGRRRGAGWDCPGGEYIYQEPPQTTSEELAVLRKAVRRSGRLPTPLVSIPSLPVSMDPSVLKGDPAKASCAYKEGVDWLLGPFLGRGAFSQCFQARDIRTGTLMAVKRLRLGKGSAFPMQEICGEGNPAAAAAMRPAPAAAAVRPAFRRKGRRQTDLSPESGEQLAAVQAEVAIMQRINHPNVLRFYGITFNPLKKQVDVFVEWMPGGSITSLLDQYGAFTEPVALAFILQVIRGLSCLHRHRILHRDLKGANLLVDATGSIIRISDFGASARLESQGSVSGQFQGQVIGTFAFMAPEVLRGEAYGRACDIWSVGCCLLEMLTGKPPWNDSRLTNQYALMFTIATAEHPPAYPKAISPAVKDFLDACFSRVPEQRPTARHLLLNPVFRDFTDSVESPGSSRSPPQCLSKSVSLPLSAVNEVRSSSRAPRALPPVPDSPNGAPPVPELCSTYDKLIMSFSHHKTPVTTSVGGTSSSKLSRRGC